MGKKKAKDQGKKTDKQQGADPPRQETNSVGVNIRKGTSQTKEKSNYKSADIGRKVKTAIVSRKKERSLFPVNPTFIVAPAVVFGAVAICVMSWENLLGWWEGPSVNKPLPYPKIIDTYMTGTSSYRERLWGSYRSNVYFGMRPRLPESLVTGMMWMTYSYVGQQPSLRHTCEHGDRLKRYGWIRHDGASFGQQEIVDDDVKLSTDFLTRSEVGRGDTWTARIRAESTAANHPTLFSLVLYIYNEGDGEMSFRGSRERGMVEEIFGITPNLGEFHFYFPHKISSAGTLFNYTVSYNASLSKLSEVVGGMMQPLHMGPEQPTLYVLPGEVEPPSGKSPRLIALQITSVLKSPLEVDMVYEAGPYAPAMSSIGGEFTLQFDARVKNFDKKFEETFKLKAKGFDDEKVAFAKAAFSNLIGGISFFHGQSEVSSKDTGDAPVMYWPASLFSGVPSRSFFPRGFLWDEGFHQLLVGNWNWEIVKEVLGHWLDLLNIDGWIPREQILGEEARAKVPEEFVVQRDSNANPPTFFLTLEALLNYMEEEDVDMEFLERLFPRLQVWFDWFHYTQNGPKSYTYRWRGRNETTDRELNPKTLTSGLDDYPRASHPSEDEYHLDLRCWIAVAARVMTRIANLIDVDSSWYSGIHRNLTDVNILDDLHWDNAKKTYSDYGLHTQHTEMIKIVPRHPKNPDIIMGPAYTTRKVAGQPSLKFVNSIGYVSLFPLLLEILPPTSDKLPHVMRLMKEPDKLLSKYGLRSLSRRDHCYQKYNTEHDPPYWRGAIWVNMNYLALKALHHYSRVEGPYSGKAAELYTQIRNNLIENMFVQYKATGYVWEQYDDRTGKGKGTHPFTGWSSLIVLIMAEKY